MTFVKKKKKKKKKKVHRSYKDDLHGMLVFSVYRCMAYFKETKSATMNIFRKIFFSKNGVCKSRIKSCFLNKSVHYS